MDERDFRDDLQDDMQDQQETTNREDTDTNRRDTDTNREDTDTNREDTDTNRRDTERVEWNGSEYRMSGHTGETTRIDSDAREAADRATNADYNTYREGGWNTRDNSRGYEQDSSQGYGREYAQSNARRTTIDEEAKTRLLIREEMKRNYKPKRNWFSTLALVLVGALLGTMGGWALSSNYQKTQTAVVESGVERTATTQPLSIKVSEEMNVESAVAAKSIPSIVGITTKVQRQSTNPFFDFGSQVGEAVGSGVIVSSDGYILTNAHVVDNGKSDEIKVSLSDGKEYDAKLLWQDATLDLAVIKVEATNLPAIEIGDSSQVSVGNKAIAIGNPLGLDLQSTLTSGYISGLNRTIQLQDGQIMDGLMQTDAAINSGNSGGALLNAEGKLIGINTARPQLADGIGFAIPINTAKPIIEKIVATGSYNPLYIGISGVNVQVYQQYTEEKFPVDTGVLVMNVYANSPAGDAGIQKGDVITQIDGKSVDSMNSLKTRLLDYTVDSKATITYYRGEEKMEKEISFHDYNFPEEVSTPSQDRP